MSELIPLSRWLLHDTPQVVARRGAQAVERDAFSARVGAWVETLRACPGERFALYHGDTAEFLAILMALWQLRRIACVAGDNQPGTVAQLRARVDGFVGEFDGEAGVVVEPSGCGLEPLAWRELESDLVLLEMYTSGSSGEPRAIGKTLGQLQREIEALQAQWPGDRDSVVLATVSHQHFYGLVIAMLWPFSAGRAFEARMCEFPEDIIHRGAGLASFTLVSSPSHLSRFSAAFDWRLLAGRCEAAFSSAAPLSRGDSLKASSLLGAPIREIYGSTETGAIAWRCQQESELDASWQPLPGVSLEVTAAGTLAVTAPYLEVERLELPDQVEFDAQGGFRLLGRVDRIVKVEGKRISLSAIEKLLRAQDWVDEARALLLERARVETAVVVQLSAAGAAFHRQAGRKALVQALKAVFAGQLETVAVPRRWRFVERMPCNSQGKLPLASLLPLFDDENARWPQIRERRLVDGELFLRCRIPPGLEYFNGHMPGRPVLPGIVQVHWAEAFGRRWLAVTGRFERLEVIKFQQVILPDYEVSITLAFDAGSGKLHFCYESDRGVHSRGRICFSR